MRTHRYAGDLLGFEVGKERWIPPTAFGLTRLGPYFLRNKQSRGTLPLYEGSRIRVGDGPA